MPAGTAARSARAAEIVSYAPHRVVVRVPKNVAGTLVLTDQYFPGWRAYADSAPRPIRPIAGLFRGVALDGRETTVEFRYRPASLLLGALVSLATLAAWLVLRLRKRIHNAAKGA